MFYSISTKFQVLSYICKSFYFDRGIS